MFRKNPVLVVGGAGFIGSHLCESLLKKGEHVICVDSLICGDILNIDDLFNRKYFTFVEADASHYSILKQIKRKCRAKDRFKISEIYYLASIASPKLYLQNPMKTLNANITGLINVLDIAKMYRSKFLYTSTSEIYGDPEVMPQTEEYRGNVNPSSERSIYDETKRCGETIVMTYHRAHKLNTKIVRVHNTFGPRLGIKDGRVVPNFVIQALKGKSLTIYGDGTQTRSFCYISDMIEALLRVMSGGFHLPLNAGNPANYYSVEELAVIINEMVGNKCELRYLPMLNEKDPRPDDPKMRQPDISLIQSRVGWQPITTLEDGLIETIKYFKERLDVESRTEQ